jgi:hypothetical protein
MRTYTLVDHDAGREITDPPLETASLLQHRVDHLERHLLGQLAQMTRRETPTGQHRHPSKRLDGSPTRLTNWPAR